MKIDLKETLRTGGWSLWEKRSDSDSKKIDKDRDPRSFKAIISSGGLSLFKAKRSKYRGPRLGPKRTTNQIR